jgi:LysM repeat protein
MSVAKPQPPTSVIVEPTDTWASLAARLEVPVGDLMAANGGTHRPLIAGEELSLP